MRLLQQTGSFNFLSEHNFSLSALFFNWLSCTFGKSYEVNGSVIFPPLQSCFAILKDHYESVCIKGKKISSNTGEA